LHAISGSGYDGTPRPKQPRRHTEEAMASELPSFKSYHFMEEFKYEFDIGTSFDCNHGEGLQQSLAVKYAVCCTYKHPM